MLLTVEYNDDVLEMFCDEQGIDLLIEKLNVLKKQGGHDHLMTPSWAGNELTEERQNLKSKLVNQLNIFLVNKSKDN